MNRFEAILQIETGSTHIHLDKKSLDHLLKKGPEVEVSLGGEYAIGTIFFVLGLDGLRVRVKKRDGRTYTVELVANKS